MNSILFSLLIVYLGSYFGILLRLGFSEVWALHSSANATLEGPLYSDFYSNIFGSFLMGLLVTLKPHTLFKNYPFTYDFLATGVLGSFTTFSGWQGAASLKFCEVKNVPHGLFCLYIGLTTSYVAFLAGLHTPEVLETFWPKKPTPTKVQQVPDQLKGEPSASEEHSYTEADLPMTQTPAKNLQEEKIFTPSVYHILGALLVVTITLAILITIYFYVFNKKYILALLCGPIGASARYYMGLNNKNWPRFPLWTFFANIFGTIVFGVGNVLDLYYDNSLISYALLSGFAGCLTTVSSFMEQCYKLNAPWSAWYSFVSILTAQSVLLIINLIYFNIQ
eukprot:TRINITY_DN12665_c0_g1_i1.p1 TRINITY_DN12665_c0_g1~~TRINITY_DN12665_c0_g1_i1.p1  ORF type:complete len:335 (-),score=62.14 TRINITY_DN12665_c0_g1_i1:17-1021(-)